MNPTFINPKEAFQQAIDKGILSPKESDQDFAGNFMYMYTQEEVNYFKNVVTRKYGHDRKTILEASQDQ
jgi:hypothetical protein